MVLPLVLACALCLSSPPARAQDAANAKTDQLIDLINHARVKAGLLPLARSSELDAAAQAHSIDMVQNRYLDHTGSDGSQPQERADQAGYHVPPNSGWIVVEVISAISADAQGPVDWWMGDDQHRNVLMNPRWREIGGGYAQGGEYGNYWTALFGCRPGVIPTVTLDGVTYTHSEECGDPAVGATLAATAQPTATVVSTPTVLPTPSVVPTPTAGVAASTAAPPAPVSLTASPATVQAGSVVNAQWHGINSSTNTDWIGLYRPGDPDIAPILWQYVGCEQVPLDARPLGSCNILLPGTLVHGAYEFRLFSANGYARLVSAGLLIE